MAGQTIATRIAYGQVALAAGAQPLATGKTELKSFVLKALATNAQPLFFGDSSVTAATGFALAAGESFTFDGNNESGQPQFDLTPTDVYVVGTAADVACWVAAGRNG